MKEGLKRIGDFFDYYEQALIDKGYPAKYLKVEFTHIRENSDKYKKEPEGDSWYKRVLLNVFIPLLNNTDEERSLIVERMFHENGSSDSSEES